MLLIVQMCFIVGIIAAIESKKTPTQDRDNTQDEDAIQVYTFKDICSHALFKYTVKYSWKFSMK